MGWVFEPFIGALIGFLTNYVAILMLFRPYDEKRVFGKRIPFTPGLIARRKSEISKAIGTVVKENLLDARIVCEMMCSESITDKIVDKILGYEIHMGEDTAEKVGQMISNIIAQIGIGDIVRKEVDLHIRKSVKDKPIVGKLVTESLIDEISKSVGMMVGEYIQKDGKYKIASVVSEKSLEISGRTVESLMVEYGMDISQIKQTIVEKYKEIMQEKCKEMLKVVKIDVIVERKVQEMSVRELEQTLLRIVDKELKAIIMLGVVIGFVIGLVNLVL